ncbi:hypothetical protein BC829DRAFT_384558, partial [Chytridium lagenaria]
QSLFSSIAQYCKSLVRISLMAVNILMMLTNCCPNIKEFRDDEGVLLGSGLDGESIAPSTAAITGLNHIVDGWKDLKSLEISTAMLSVSEFSESLRLLGSRLRSLSITHFRDSLNILRKAWDTGSSSLGKDNLETFVSGLRRLENLEVLALDLSMSPHQDGLSAPVVERLLSACPRLKGFEYYAALDAYFEIENEFNDGVSVFEGANRMYQNLGEDSLSVHGLRRAHFNPTVESIVSRSRRGSVGSLSVMTTNTGYYGFSSAAADRHYGSVSVFSKDEDERDDDVTSLAPGLPSPNPLGNNRVDLYGTWVPEDSKTIRQRAEEELLQYGRFLSKPQFEFFCILEEIATACKLKDVRITIAWTMN